jgi:cation diffusion facilitator family transporter
MSELSAAMRNGRRMAIASVAASAVLALLNVTAGLLWRSTSVTAAGVEFAGDVLASLVVLLGILAAAKPPDADHPYGHGRLETLAGLFVGLMLVAGGAAICYQSLQRVNEVHPSPAISVLWAPGIAAVVKAVLSYAKFQVGRRVRSAALIADAWNDAVDILSAAAAMIAVGLALYDPSRFLAADHYGGVAVGLVVVYSGLRVARDASLQLIDTMPDDALMQQIRAVAMTVPKVRGVEKCFARKTGLQYHVDLHLEVDPEITVRESHEIATQVRIVIRETMDSIADVLVHVEPAP